MDARRRLRDAGIDMYELEARLICAAAAGKTRDMFMRDLQMYTNSEELEETIRAQIARRAGGEPTAYILGEWEFYSVPLTITRGVIVPRADTEVLAEAALRLVKQKGGDARLLDMCTGSGCVGIAVAANAPRCRVVLADNSAAALAVAQTNVTRNNLTLRTSCIEADALDKPPRLFGSFDVIVCNPPYIPTRELDTLDSSVREYEPRAALDGGVDGLQFYRAIIRNWATALRDDGAMAFECGAGQAEYVRAVMEENGFGGVAVIKDTRDVDRVVAGIKM
jgi:release factor glutamine methyltransferase